MRTINQKNLYVCNPANIHTSHQLVLKATLITMSVALLITTLSSSGCAQLNPKTRTALDHIITSTLAGRAPAAWHVLLESAGTAAIDAISHDWPGK